MPAFPKFRRTLVVSALGLALVAASWLAVPALSAPKKSVVSEVDKNFLIAANESNVSEIAYAPVVMKRASGTFFIFDL